MKILFKCRNQNVVVMFGHVFFIVIYYTGSFHFIQTQCNVKLFELEIEK